MTELTQEQADNIQTDAETATADMYQNDAATQALGMRLDRIGAGSAVLTMTVREDMINGHGTCHGGMIFSLADSAFAFACNSDGRVSVALKCEIDFLAPALLGDRLIARAERRAQGRRTGVYDVTVSRLADRAAGQGNQAGNGDTRTSGPGGEEQIVALFRGNSYRVGQR